MDKLYKKIKMKLLSHIHQQDTSNLFLYGAIMFANIDYVGIVDYVIKAVLGGAVWFAFKLMQDYYSVRMRNKAGEEFKDPDHKKDQNHNEEK